MIIYRREENCLMIIVKYIYSPLSSLEKWKYDHPYSSSDITEKPVHKSST